TRAKDYAALLQGNQLALSFMTVAELFQWSAIHKWSEPRIKQLEQTLSNYLVIPVDIELCRSWGNLRAEMQIIGRPISVQDAWIAATALLYNLPLVTHNVKDFSRIPGLEVRTSP
ncbi:MAG: type II toxin-antitoxin system VapC family toxin, partial [Leptolyngbyaceae cyanobacterium SL_5_14]|nr:type II toxin-antitoxin system VapC family toxin [Leptolyngbyaceae cyanobacterium SL_5_14]